MAIALLGLLVPGVAHAAPPPNDDFDRAAPIGTLPFSTTQPAEEATSADDDPSHCYSSHHSVWFTYTARADGVVTASTAGSGYDTTLSAHTGTRGALTQVGCNDEAEGTSQSRVDIPVVAGVSYHFAVSAYRAGSAGSLTFSVAERATPAPANDAFAGAEPVTALPHAVDAAELSAATAEPAEPSSECGPTTQSLWYAVTLPVTTPVTLSPSTAGARFEVYTGPAIGSLTAIGCARFGSLTFRATAGTTYHVRLTTDYADPAPMRFVIGVARPIVPRFSHYPITPSTLSDVTFYDFTEVPDASGPFTTRWDFGDGTSGEGDHPQHRYAADGDYRVTLTVSAEDGREGTTSKVVRVRTPAVTAFTAAGGLDVA